ncbi:MAG TPA: hypothetical protein PKO36_04730 [Candidatus Hydrogenedentes bacterium]|nr:hypothetical protein [Candidatus Hydrogenedentota bacterium]HOV76176.1 hypothetical protein [Candidatus Hydrogenedentota bacterium]
MKKMLAVSGIIILLLAACSAPAPPPPPPEEQAPPPPTPEEIAAKIRPVLQPLEAIVAQGPHVRNLNITMEIRDKVVADLKLAKQQNQGSENGKQALRMITYDIQEIIRKARDQNRFLLILGAISAYEVLEPIGLTMQRLKERAELEVTTPYITIKGFFDDNATGEIYAFLDVRHPIYDASQTVRDPLDTSSWITENVRVRKGEEFFNCRLVDFVGNKKGVVLEYLKIPGKTWKVMAE